MKVSQSTQVIISISIVLLMIAHVTFHFLFSCTCVSWVCFVLPLLPSVALCRPESTITTITCCIFCPPCLHWTAAAAMALPSSRKFPPLYYRAGFRPFPLSVWCTPAAWQLRQVSQQSLPFFFCLFVFTSFCPFVCPALGEVRNGAPIHRQHIGFPLC